MSERSRRKRPRTAAAPNLADDFSELCDALKAKYDMTEGDWKALLDMGMGLYNANPVAAQAAATGTTSPYIEALRTELTRHVNAFIDGAAEELQAQARSGDAAVAAAAARMAATRAAELGVRFTIVGSGPAARAAAPAAAPGAATAAAAATARRRTR